MRISSPNDLLPIKTHYSKQLLDALLSSGNVTMIRAPPGTGKTMAALAYLFWTALHGTSSAIFFRTRAELDNAIRMSYEISRLLEKYNVNPPLFIPIGGKEEFCRFPPDKKELVRWWCSIIDCEYFGRRNVKRVINIMKEYKPKDLRGFFIAAREAKACPYFAYQELCSEARIILGTHPYFILDELFERIGKRDIIVIDEAHWMLFLITARMRLRDYEWAREYLNRIEAGISLVRAAIREWRMGNREAVRKLATYQSFSESPGIITINEDEVLKVCPPALLIQKRMRSVKKIILLSSTLYPIGLYKKLFGEEKASVHVIPGLLQCTEKRLITGLSIGLTTRYTDRAFVIKKYADAIKYLLQRMNYPTIIFAPNYDIAHKLADYLKIPLIREEKNILHEVIVTVSRGRLAEGIDVKLNGKYPVLAIIAGLPYPDITREFRIVARVYSKYYKISLGEMMRTLELSEMISALAQAIGRVGRKERGVAIIIDDRVEKIGLKIPIYKSLNMLIRRIKKFLSRLENAKRL